MRESTFDRERAREYYAKLARGLNTLAKGYSELAGRLDDMTVEEIIAFEDAINDEYNSITGEYRV